MSDEVVVPAELVTMPGSGSDVEKQDVETIEQPAKVMRIGSMIKQLLDEVRAAPLDERSRDRLRDIYETSVRELGEALSPDLRDELDRLAPPFADDDAERRRAARRQGAAGGVARGPVPRHPGDAVRPAGRRPPAARADAGPAPAWARPADRARPAARDVPLTVPATVQITPW